MGAVFYIAIFFFAGTNLLRHSELRAMSCHSNSNHLLFSRINITLHPDTAFLLDTFLTGQNVLDYKDLLKISIH
jgi:hypothetical protein